MAGVRRHPTRFSTSGLSRKYSNGLFDVLRQPCDAIGGKTAGLERVDGERGRFRETILRREAARS